VVKPLQVRGAVDVEREQGLVDHDGLYACGSRALDRSLGRIWDPEDRLEATRARERQRVQAAIECRHEPDGSARSRETVERAAGRERAVGHDHQSSAGGATVGERGRDRSGVSVTGIHEDIYANGGQLRVRCDHERARDGFALPTGCENCGEHPPHQLRPLVRREERGKSCLRPVQALDRHDRKHALSLHA
jgi:hypothetical protein